VPYLISADEELFLSSFTLVTSSSTSSAGAARFCAIDQSINVRKAAGLDDDKRQHNGRTMQRPAMAKYGERCSRKHEKLSPETNRQSDQLTACDSHGEKAEKNGRIHTTNGTCPVDERTPS